MRIEPRYQPRGPYSPRLLSTAPRRRASFRRNRLLTRSASSQVTRSASMTNTTPSKHVRPTNHRSSLSHRRHVKDNKPEGLLEMGEQFGELVVSATQFEPFMRPPAVRMKRLVICDGGISDGDTVSPSRISDRPGERGTSKRA